MGFTLFEKQCFRKTVQDIDIEHHFPTDVNNFLTSEGFRGQVRDYAIIPERSKLGKPENIVMTYVLSTDRNVFDILKDWQSFLSPPV